MQIHNRRCSICNCTDSPGIATNPEEYHPGLKFNLVNTEVICTECEYEINNYRQQFEDEDELNGEEQ